MKNLLLRPAKYFASEIDIVSKLIAAKNHGNDIINVGDIENITEEKIMEMCPIHLLIGGSPCQDLSIAKQNREGLQGLSNKFSFLNVYT